MENRLYEQALPFFNKGEYEEVLKIFRHATVTLSDKEKNILRESRKQVTEQYCYIIKEYIRQGDYSAAHNYKEEYEAKYGDNPQIEAIEVPIQTVSKVTEKVINEIPENNIKKTSIFSNVTIIISGIITILIAIIVVWQFSKEEDTPIIQQETIDCSTNATQQQNIPSATNTYEETSANIVNEWKSKYGNDLQVIATYPELSHYCLATYFDGASEGILIYDLKKQSVHKLSLPELSTVNDGEIFVASIQEAFMNQNNDRILLLASNGAISEGGMEYLLLLDPTDYTVRALNYGAFIEHEKDKIKVSARILTKPGEHSPVENEYAYIVMFHDLNGKLLKPVLAKEVLNLKGVISSSYNVTMQLSISNDEIYGQYYYDKNGSNNILYLYGGISNSNDVVLLEFNSKEEQTGLFQGVFGSNSFSGTFINYKGKEMPFELYLDNNSLNMK